MVDLAHLRRLLAKPASPWLSDEELRHGNARGDSCSRSGGAQVKRSITMTVQQAYAAYSSPLSDSEVVEYNGIGCPGVEPYRALRVAREAERRLIEKLAAVPVERLVKAAIGTTTARGEAEAVRKALLSAVREET